MFFPFIRHFPAAGPLALIALIATGPVAQAETTLIFGTYTSDKPSAMVAQVRPSLNLIARHMSGQLGTQVSIRMQVVKSYKEGVDNIVAGKFDFMRLGPASYVMAKDRSPGITILAMENKNGAKQFNGIIAVAQDSDITSMRQLRGRSFAFGSKRSTLGRYFAQLTLRENGIHAGDLAKFEYLGRHDKVGMAVGSGLFDAGALEETTFGKLVKRGVKIRALAKFSNATRPWIARAGLSARTEKSLRQALLSLNDSKALKSLRFEGFLPGNESDYTMTRRAIVTNPEFFTPVEARQ